MDAVCVSIILLSSLYLSSSYSLDTDSACVNSKAALSSAAEDPTPPSGLCLDRIGNDAYVNLVPHPDGSDLVFLYSIEGLIWLASVPKEGSGDVFEVNLSNPFLDITDQVLPETDFGLLGIAFHPNFVNNGRFFISYNCDKKQPRCAGICACNKDINCDPSQIPPDHGIEPCQYHSVIAEFTANSTSSNPSLANAANHLEVRRIFTMGLPYHGVHGGQILFGPGDGYLYFMIGDGSRRNDPQNFAQNKRSLLGKILRLDIDKLPSANEIHDRRLLGNYSIPKDNPYLDDNELAPEIWAMGFRNTWRCSFDSERPIYFLCGDIGQDEYEEVDLIVKGGNYGWRIYEGPYLTSGESHAPIDIRTNFPVMGYNHSVNKHVGSAAIIGGYFYRSMTDPCMYGRYLFMDLYGADLWTGIENPKDSKNFTTSKINFSCASDSSIPCESAAGGLPVLGSIFSFAEDNKRDIFILTSNGIYRVTNPSRCNYHCPKESEVNTKPHSPSPVSENHNRGSFLNPSLIYTVLGLFIFASEVPMQIFCFLLSFV